MTTINEYRIERCRSQHVRDVPQTWEEVAAAADEADALRQVRDWRQHCRASGDQFRVTAPDGDVVEEYR